MTKRIDLDPLMERVYERLGRAMLPEAEDLAALLFATFERLPANLKDAAEDPDGVDLDWIAGAVGTMREGKVPPPLSEADVERSIAWLETLPERGS